MIIYLYLLFLGVNHSDDAKIDHIWFILFKRIVVLWIRYQLPAKMTPEEVVRFPAFYFQLLMVCSNWASVQTSYTRPFSCRKCWANIPCARPNPSRALDCRRTRCRVEVLWSISWFLLQWILEEWIQVVPLFIFIWWVSLTLMFTWNVTSARWIFGPIECNADSRYPHDHHKRKKCSECTLEPFLHQR